MNTGVNTAASGQGFWPFILALFVMMAFAFVDERWGYWFMLLILLGYLARHPNTVSDIVNRVRGFQSWASA